MRYFLCMFVLLFAMGCVTIRVSKEPIINKDTGDLIAMKTSYKYSRWLGSQNLENVSMKTPEGGSFKIGKQAGENTLDDAILSLASTVNSLAKTAARMP